MHASWTKKALFKSAFFIFALALFASTAQAELVRVKSAVDGDSLLLHDGRMLRLIGVNAPEFGKESKLQEPLAREAQAALATLVEGKEVNVEYDEERHDRYRRTLVHVFLADGRSVQQLLLRAGLGFVIANPPNLAHLDIYMRAEQEARREVRGVWGHPYFKAHNAAQITAIDAGFRLVRGKVQRIGQSRHALYLDLAPNLTLVIPRNRLASFGVEPQRFLQRNVIARGWIVPHKNKLRLTLSHPAMLEVID